MILLTLNFQQTGSCK